MIRSRRKQGTPSSKNKFLALLIVILGIFAGIVILQIIPTLQKISVAPKTVANLVLHKDINLKNDNGRINLVLLGIGGKNHDGPNLSDTIIFASINPETKKTTLVSIPRDLWVPSISNKINEAYASGEDKKPGTGLPIAEKTVSEVVGQPVHYGIRIDFSGFERFVDQLGGIDVTVDRTLDDYAYPVEGKEDDPCGKSTEELQQLATASADNFEAFPCRYEHLHFTPGKTHMDGATALKFVRSRHGVGIEGSDFARSQRQQKVISAIKDKVFSLNVLLNPVKIGELSQTLGDSIDTDIKEDDYDDFIRLAQKIKDGKIANAALDQGDGTTGRVGLLMNPPLAQYGGRWVLIPPNEDFGPIKTYVGCEITHVATSAAEIKDICASYK